MKVLELVDKLNFLLNNTSSSEKNYIDYDDEVVLVIFNQEKKENEMYYLTQLVAPSVVIDHFKEDLNTIKFSTMIFGK